MQTLFGPAAPVCATTIPNVTDVAVTPGALAVLAAAVDPVEPATVVPVFADPDLVLLLQAVTANATATPNDTANRPRTTTPSRHEIDNDLSVRTIRGCHGDVNQWWPGSFT
ncbi:MAG TPA: hypothetical protein VKQ71_05725 [Acidimicrobiales bacterium]|nr:hypothetical protein [Acidimicrobiales bacterium]